jgi:hypothetical protein
MVSETDDALSSGQNTFGKNIRKKTSEKNIRKKHPKKTSEKNIRKKYPKKKNLVQAK